MKFEPDVIVDWNGMPKFKIPIVIKVTIGNSTYVRAILLPLSKETVFFRSDAKLTPYYALKALEKETGVYRGAVHIIEYKISKENIAKAMAIHLGTSEPALESDDYKKLLKKVKKSKEA